MITEPAQVKFAVPSTRRATPVGIQFGSYRRDRGIPRAADPVADGGDGGAGPGRAGGGDRLGPVLPRRPPGVQRPDTDTDAKMPAKSRVSLGQSANPVSQAAAVHQARRTTDR